MDPEESTVSPDSDVALNSTSGTIVESDPDPETMPPKVLRRNMLCCVLMDSGWAMGWGGGIIIALSPLLVFLGASNTIIGVVTGASLAGILGIFLTPFITLRFPYKKWYFIIANIPYLFPLAVIGVLVLLSGNLGISNASLVTLTMVLMLAHWFFGGFLALPHQEYMVACIPSTHRGRLSGLYQTVGSLLGLAAVPISGIVLAKIVEPFSYGYLFLFGWFFMQVFYVAAIFPKERRTPVEKSPYPWSKAMLKAFWNDKNYVKYSCLAVLRTLFLGTNIWAFLNVYGFKEVDMAPQTSAIMAGIMLVVRITCATPLGVLADKVGPKRLLPIWILVSAAAPLPAVLLCSPMAVYASIALAYFSKLGADTTSIVIGYGLPRPENRAGHFTITMVLGVAMLGLGPILLGIFGDIFSLRIMFTVISGIGLLIFLLALYLVRTFPDSTRDLS